MAKNTKDNYMGKALLTNSTITYTCSNKATNLNKLKEGGGRTPKGDNSFKMSQMFC